MALRFLFSISILVVGIHSTVLGQAIFSIDNDSVSQKSFKENFEKNRISGNYKEELQTYLELSINYYLKLKEAKRMRLDTLPKFTDESKLYAEKLAERIEKNEFPSQALLDTALEHSNKDILARYIKIPFDPSNKLSLKVAQTHAEALRDFMQRTPDNSKLMGKINENGNRGSVASLGWTTLFSLPFEFEKALYSLAQHQVSLPIIGKNAVYLFQVLEHRNAIGKRSLAHILLYIDPSSDPTIKAEKRLLVDSIYKLIKSGENFGKLANTFSQDPTSNKLEGVMQPFGMGKFSEEFEKPAFALQSIGDVTPPFQTQFGFHILKLLAKLPPLPADSTAAVNQIIQDPAFEDWVEIEKNHWADSMAPIVNYNSASIIDSTALKLEVNNRGNFKNKYPDSTLLFSIGNKGVLIKDLLKYFSSIHMVNLHGNISNLEAFRKCKTQSIISYYHSNLKTFNPEYNKMLKEFEENNLVFELSDNMVWSGASSNQKGQIEYYNSHKEKYNWKNGADAAIVVGLDSLKVATMRKQIIKSSHNWRQIIEKGGDGFFADSTRLENDQLPAYFLNRKIKKGIASLVEINNFDGTFGFAYIFNPKPGGTLKTFEEAQAFVVSDYQQLLEGQWIQELRKKYRVWINKDLFQQMANHQN